MTASLPPPAPRVTVILPFHNETRFLPGAVESVRSQSMPDWELVLVDDGSTDGSGELADELASNADAKVSVLRHPDGAQRGLVASRNLGVEEATANAIAFIDADDRWEPVKLEVQLDVLDGDPTIGMTCSPVWYRTLDGSRPDVLKTVGTGTRRFEAGELCRALMRRAVEPPPPSNVMFRTAALRQIGGVPAGDSLFEDQRTFFALNLVHAVHLTDVPLSTYTCRDDSLFGSLAGRDDVKYQQREAFEHWAMRWGSRRGSTGRRVAAETFLRRTAARTRWRARATVRRALPEERHPGVHHVVRRVRRGRVRWGSFRQLTPIAGNWGLDRGQPVDRYFIERFVERHRHRIRGRVLEVQDPEYTVKFGSGVERSDVLDIDPGNPEATIIADLQIPGSLPADRYDCAIVTQTLQFMDDLVVSIGNLWQSLAPGGTLLVTMPTVSKLEESLAHVERWRLTPRGLDDVLRRACPDGDVEVEGYGNILVSTAFLYGLVTDEFRSAELDHYDPIFPSGACGRVTKGAGAS